MKTNKFIYQLTAWIFTAAILCSGNARAQQFLDKGAVEFEVKTNIQKTMGSGSWDEMLKSAMSQFKTGYFTFSFSGNKSIYKFDHWDPQQKIPEWFRRNDEDNVWYMDHDAGNFMMKKSVFGSDFFTQDSIPNISWRLTNESRLIAGFNCRKAVGQISDSVYVFAFYTDEILIPGGPCSINGLPGMILGMTVPRLYTSWIATKVMLNNAALNDIKPITAKKFMTMGSMKALVKDRTKDWVSQDDPDSKKWMDQLFWNLTL